MQIMGDTKQKPERTPENKAMTAPENKMLRPAKKRKKPQTEKK
jgi:hypothetical protein